MPAVARFPWERIAPASVLESAVAAWADATAWPDAGGVLGAIGWLRTAVVDAAGVDGRLRDPTAALVAIGRGGAQAIAVVPWRLWRAIAAAVLDEPAAEAGELAAPRPPTPVERALAAFAIADGLERAGVAASVALIEAPAVGGGAVLVCELAVSAPIAAELMVIVPALPPPPRRAVADLLRRRAHRLPPIVAQLELARGRLAHRADLAGLRARDVIVVGPATPRLCVGRGAIAVAVRSGGGPALRQGAGPLDPGGDRLTVVAPYRRTMADDPADPLADDLAIPLAIVIADVAVSARHLLELAPGEVLACDRPIGAAVELRAGARVVARGELVTVDGALGVRVIEVAGDRPLVAAAPAVLDGTPR